MFYSWKNLVLKGHSHKKVCEIITLNNCVYIKSKVHKVSQQTVLYFSKSAPLTALNGKHSFRENVLLRLFFYQSKNENTAHLLVWISSMISSDRMESLSRSVLISMLLSFSTVFP
jgi:hypothetical protein